MADQIDNVVDVVIERKTSTPSMASFSEHLVVAEFDASGMEVSFDAEHRVKQFGSLDEIAEAGFDTDGFVYKACQAQYSQSPHIKKIYVGWKNSTETWVQALDAIKAQNNEWYALTVGTRTLLDQQSIATWVQANEKLCILASGDETIINEDTGDIGSYIRTQGIDRVGVIYHPDCNDETTVVHTVYSEDGENFFENEELTIPATIPEGVTPTLVSGNEYEYSTVVHGINPNDPIPEASWFGKMLTKQPGSATWALKTLQSLPVYDLGGGAVTKCRNKNVNTYLSCAGISITQEGQVGSGEYIDVIHGCDWLKARIQNLVFGVIVNQDKVPYTDTGVQMVVSPLKQALDEAVKYDILKNYEVEYPAVADISATEKGSRFLPDVKFTAELSGAIHSTRINGVITL